MYMLSAKDISDISSETDEINLIGSKKSTLSTKFCVFESVGGSKDGHPGLRLAETFSSSL